MYDLDPEEYLPPTTLQWCNDFLRVRGFNPYSPPPIPLEERQSVWLEHYLALRIVVNNYINSGAEPRLGLTPKPEGALLWDGPDVRPIQTSQGFEDGGLEAGELVNNEGRNRDFQEWLEAITEII